jgi:hypothetical protein
LRHGIGCVNEPDTPLCDILHSTIDDLGPGSATPRVGVVIKAVEQDRD